MADADPPLPPVDDEPPRRGPPYFKRNCCNFHCQSLILIFFVVMHIAFFFDRWIRDYDTGFFNNYAALLLQLNCLIGIGGFIGYRLYVYWTSPADDSPVPYVDFTGYARVDTFLSNYLGRFLCPFVCSRHLLWTGFLNGCFIVFVDQTSPFWIPWVMPRIIGDRYNSPERVHETLIFMLAQMTVTLYGILMFRAPLMSRQAIEDLENRLTEMRRQEGETKREEQERRRREERERREAEQGSKGWVKKKPQSRKKDRFGF